MIKIFGKGCKYLLLQLSDFLGIAKTIVVSLESVESKKNMKNIWKKIRRQKG